MTTQRRSACLEEVRQAQIAAERALVAACITARIEACARATTFGDRELTILSNWWTTGSGHGNPCNSKDKAACPSIVVIHHG
jgi:hypothetical protein